MGYYRIEPNPLTGANVDSWERKVFRAATIPPLRALWAWIEFLSVLPLVLVRVYLPLMLGYVVIAERYVFDSVVAISYILGDNGFTHSWRARTLLRMIPKDALLVYLRSDYQCILLRRGRLAESPRFIEHQIRQYDALAAAFGCPVISTGNRSVQETQALVRTLATRYAGRSR